MMKKMSKRSPKATKIMIIRHAEKPNRDTEPFGVSENGKREKESLQVRGWQRAGALANLLAPANVRFQYDSLATPKFLFASKFLKRKGSKRSIETITPLAEKLGLEINSTFARSNFEDMLEEACSCKGAVLICWQHEYIPRIAAQILGKGRISPPRWPEDRYDMIWVFDLDRSSVKYTFKQVPQRLLQGDSRTLIR